MLSFIDLKMASSTLNASELHPGDPEQLRQCLRESQFLAERAAAAGGAAGGFVAWFVARLGDDFMKIIIYIYIWLYKYIMVPATIIERKLRSTKLRLFTVQYRTVVP